MADLILDEIKVPETLDILLLEDEKIFHDHMITLLDKIGFKGKLDQAWTVKEANSFSKNHTYGFVFSDWNLPDGTGLHFLQNIRKMENYNKTPFIMVTSQDDVFHILQATNEGSDGYIVKTCTEKELIESISFAYKKRTN